MAHNSSRIGFLLSIVVQIVAFWKGYIHFYLTVHCEQLPYAVLTTFKERIHILLTIIK